MLDILHLFNILIITVELMYYNSQFIVIDVVYKNKCHHLHDFL